MSSISSYSGANSVVSPNNPYKTPLNMDKLKTYTCPKCKRIYDFFYRNGIFLGKVPLILHCNHTMCEECIRTTFNKGEVTCADCQQPSTVDINLKLKIQDVFVVNFYVLGKIYYTKPCVGDTSSKLSLKPAGVSYKNRHKALMAQSELTDDSLRIIYSSIGAYQEQCSQAVCKKAGEVRCFECNEVYCVTCCQMVHKVARGLQTHKITPLSLDCIPELNEKCKEDNLLLEFYCNLCNTVECCYCILRKHTGHDYCQLSILDDASRPQFDVLVQNGEEKLKKLLFAYQKASKELNNNCIISTTTDTELEIAKYFTDIHARLQRLEEQLCRDITMAKNSKAVTLNNISGELAVNIRNLSGLLSAAKNVLYKSNPDMKFNIRVIMERLESVLNLPCYLTGQPQNLDMLGFEHGNFLENLERNFSVNVSSEDSFRLVTEDDVPDDYDVILPDAISLLNIDDINHLISGSSRIGSSTSDIPSLMGPQKYASTDALSSNILLKSEDSSTSSVTIENWIQNGNEEIKKSNSIPSLRNDDRENINVTHIDTPECFYVHLVRYDKALCNLSKEIDQYVRNFPPIVDSPELNKLYIVKYEMRHQRPAWYRGRVIDIIMDPKGEDHYCIQFIDYGNSMIVTRHMLRVITASLAKPKPFAIQCKLMNIYPQGDQWNAKTMKLMAQIINGNEVIMVVMNSSDGILEVDLISMPHGSSVRDALIFIGDAVPYLSNSTPLTELALKHLKAMPRLHKRTEHFVKGQIVDVYISHVIDPYNIYIQMADFEHHISHLSSVMATYYNNKVNRVTGNSANYSSKNDNIYVPRKDMIVAVYTEDASSWYRGTVVKKHDGQGLVDIFLVDIGKLVTVSYTNIRKLVERFRNLECQAILVKMVHIKPCNGQTLWDVTANCYFNKYIAQKYPLRMRTYNTQSTVPEVLLFEYSSTVDICINALMVQEHVAEALPDASLQVEWFHEDTTSKVQKEMPYVMELLDTIQSNKKGKKENDDSGEEIDNASIIRKPVNVLVAKSPDLIYVALKDQASKRAMHNLHLELHDYYSKHHSTTNSIWKENDPCVVLNKNNNVYYRAIIIQEIEKSLYKVLLRDTAEEITVRMDDIYTLEDQFKEALEGAVRCHMGGIIPAGDPKKWSFMAIEFLQNLFQNESHIFLSKAGPVDTERKSICVEMWYSEYKPGAALEPSKTIYHSISKQLIKNGLALKERVSSTKSVPSLVANTNLPKMEDKPRTNNKRKERIPKETYNKSKPKARNNKNTKANGVIRPLMEIAISLKPQGEKYYSTDAAFVHPGVENIPPQSSSVEAPMPVETNQFFAALTKNIPIPKSVFPILACPLDNPSVSDWNEIMHYEENKQNDSNTSVSEWQPPIPFKARSFECNATFVDDSAYIYLHDNNYENILQEMEEKMKNMFDPIPPEPKGTIWVPGQMCTVKYFVTNNWYRGQIADVLDDVIKVFMIDYGNTEDCKHDDLRFKVMYTGLPAFANKIQLHKVFPKSNDKWLTSDLDELHRSVVDKKIHVTLKGDIQPNCVVPAIVKVDDIIINEWMLQRSSNLAPLRVKPAITQDTEDVIVEEEQTNDNDQAIKIPNFLPPSASYVWKPLKHSLENKKVKIGVVNVFSFNEFIIEFLENEDPEDKILFNTVSDDIEKRAPNQPVLYELQIGQACVTQFSGDGKWYRGQIFNLEDMEHGSVMIWFVDFGNLENVKREDVRAIHHDWLKLPVQQYISQIYAIELNDEENLEDAITKMSAFCNTIKMAEVMSVEPLIIQLYDDNNELSYKDLIENNIISYRK